MLRYLPGRLLQDRPPGDDQSRRGVPRARPLNVSPMLTGVRLGVLALTLIILPFTRLGPDGGAARVTWDVAIGVSIAAWLVWMLVAVVPRVPARDTLFIASLAVLAASGGILAGLSTLSPAIAVGCVVTASAGVRLRPELSLAITAETVAAFIFAGVAAGAPAGTLLGFPLAFVGLWAFGMTRQEFLLRAEQAERTLEQTRRAREAEMQAAALAERARIAREIHDVLAHSLGAVSVNLQAAEGLLSGLPDSPELAKALECVERAGAYTRDGLAEARHAVRALRENASLATAPLGQQLEQLITEFRATGDATVEFRASGEQRPVAAEVVLAVYRTAQEALSNARKHAPGQPVTLSLEFTPDTVGLNASNPLPGPAATPIPTESPTARTALAASGGGHGLTGLRERAALTGGTLTAGPADGQWQVCLKIPG
ncbi:MAG TPA: histidine kinase [Trebonia sp.]